MRRFRMWFWERADVIYHRLCPRSTGWVCDHYDAALMGMKVSELREYDKQFAGGES